MTRILRASLCSAIGFVTAFGVSPVAADDDLRGHYPEVEIDGLKAEVVYAGGEWLVEVKFEVEIDSGRPIENLGLLLSVSEHGRPLVDPDGKPIEFLIALDRPTEVDDDEIEFESRITFGLPDGAFSDPGELRLHAAVVVPDVAYALDTKEHSIRYHEPRPAYGGFGHHRYGHISIGYHSSGYRSRAHHSVGYHRVSYHRISRYSRPRHRSFGFRFRIGCR